MTTVAPSETHRSAVANPIPVPAAAVTTTILPSSSPWPVGPVGGPVVGLLGGPLVGPVLGRQRAVAYMDSQSIRPFQLRRKSENPLGDDIPLDLVGSSVDGVGAAEEEQGLELGE